MHVWALGLSCETPAASGPTLDEMLAMNAGVAG